MKAFVQWVLADGKYHIMVGLISFFAMGLGIYEILKHLGVIHVLKP